MTNTEKKRQRSPHQPVGRWIRVEKRAAIYERDGWECAYCGRGPRDKRNLNQAAVILSLDHLTPREQGGSNGSENLVSCCRACNSSRQNRDWRDFAPGGAQERIEFLVLQPLDITLGKAIVASLEGDVIEDAR